MAKKKATAAKTPARSSPQPEDDAKTFLKLSTELTGYDQLDADLAAEYYERIRAGFGQRLDDLLSDYANNGDVAGIMGDDEHSRVAQEIIMLWYMSGFQDPTSPDPEKPRELGPETPEQYFRGLFWPTVRAHPLGLSGGYFGYWRYPPEN